MKFYEHYLKAKEVLFRTEDFFRKAKTERGIKHAFLYLVILTFTFMLFTTYYYLDKFAVFSQYIGEITGLPVNTGLFQLNFQTFIIFYVLLAIFTVLFAFARYWIVHFFIRLFKKKASYEETYRALSYSTAPGYAGAPFLIAWILLLPFLNNWWAWIIFVPSLIIYIGLELYSLYVRSKAVSVTHSMHMLLSFTCIYILGTLGFLIALIILEIIIIVPLVLLFYAP